MKTIFSFTCLLLFASALMAQSLVKDINPGSSGAQINSIEILNSELFFMGDNGSLGAELWTSNGTSSGTAILKDIYLGSGNGYPAQFEEMGGELYFRADHASYGFEIWKTDGTSSGTVLLKDVNPGTADGVYTSIDFDIAASNGKVYMPLDEGTYGRELWVSDGTSAGTIRLLDTYVGSIGTINGAGDPKELTPFGNGILFSSYDYDLNLMTGLGRELYRSNGTVGGTVMIKDIHPGAGSSYPDNFLVVAGGSKALFAADNGSDGKELWITDATSSGTSMLKDINPGIGSSNPSNLVKVGSEVFFYADDGTNGKELWKTDGTPSGTVLVKDIYAGSNDSEVAPFIGVTNSVEFGGKLFFVAKDGISGQELWVSDGTSAGTYLMKDIYPGNLSSYASYLEVAGGYLWLYANDGTHGYELWVCDGINTVLYADIYPGPSSGSPTKFNQIGNYLYFTANNGASGSELFSLDLSSVGALPVELLSFDASLQADRSIALTWTTSLELHNDYFVVERSTDGLQFEAIQKVEGKGSTTNKSHYEARDAFPLEGQNTYRLRQVDMDGTSHYSSLVMVEVQARPTRFSAFPNPVQDKFELSFATSKTLRWVELIDLQGRVLEQIRVEAGSSSILCSVSGLAKGIYILRLRGNGETESLRFTKLK